METNFLPLNVLALGLEVVHKISVAKCFKKAGFIRRILDEVQVEEIKRNQE